MLRIRGTIGAWPVDLSVELGDEDWARLAAHWAAGAPVQPPERATLPSTDGLWDSAQALLRQAGQVEGTALLAELQALAGNAAAGKRLLVRLRHSPQVQVESGVETPLYRWIG
ncbi:hypothetical protein D3880_03000 [Pseudomonas cavernae]|uniref:Uncharacterized protein n=1 Tax=Pseudomonas cavernae TaxID=2320867 RepID=A0A385Z0K7_9PSED|nr:hypothetical protein [Pseudomonas cavernae]AYC31418.1 hypothetical protein D3880_03000 [Pseudomonas cavernae]